jgi:hydrogenase maturation protein HypF
MTERREIAVQGIVQGVGFRPFVYGLAQKHHLAGFVRNDNAGVMIELEGESRALDSFVQSLAEAPPPLAIIERIACQAIAPKGESDFAIIESRADDQRQIPIVPDAATCDDCLRELFDPRDRRFRYPFINCTNCGPRFTIVKDVPYDRPLTTMAGFQMCAACEREYHDPANRRFHAQPNACPACGPQLILKTPGHAEAFGDEALVLAASLVKRGKILAIKGLGGYHLACSACDNEAVSCLRQRKQREDKPFALMTLDLDAVRRICSIDAAEESLLLSHRRPIVLLRKCEPNPIAAQVAPGQSRFGVMLPYAPLHYLLLDQCRLPLVMTSGNLSDEPIAFADAEAFERLSAITDIFLLHDRPIHMRCDDSVVRVVASRQTVIRRARGYAPAPLRMSKHFVEPILACGAELKNTFCLAKDDRAYLSHHIGDLANYEAYRSYTEAIEHYQRLFDIRPTVVAHDLHPQYLSTQYAQQINSVTRIAVQHHHAHIASCMAENNLTGPVLGVAFDGLGYGDDGAIWGGEFLIADFAGYEQVAHLRYVPLAGGDTAIRQPWRAALSYLQDAPGCGNDPRALGLHHWENITTQQIALSQAMMERNLNTVRTSSSGRLFDAVASIVGLRHEVNYEGQAAIELEAAALAGVEERYPFEIGTAISKELDFRPTIGAIVRDVQRGVDISRIAAKFHNTVSAAIVETCCQLRQNGAPRQVCLGGGTFQNVYLIERLLPALAKHGFDVFLNSLVPSNDGGISLGQTLVANATIQRGG